MAERIINTLVWDENPGHAPKEVYPNSIRGAVADGLNELGAGRVKAVTAHQDEPEQGLSEERLSAADVLVWWAHIRHHKLEDDVLARVIKHVEERGMGFIALHSAHYSRPFKTLLHDEGHLKGGWRELTPMEPEEIRVCAPNHPIAQGVSDFRLEHEEMYGAPFQVPPPSCVVLQSYFPHDGRYFPSGITWTVGPGKTPGFTSGGGKGECEGEGIARMFYFRPGHETEPTYFHPVVRRVILNAVVWCARGS